MRLRFVTSAALAATLVRSIALNTPCGLRTARSIASKAGPRTTTVRVGNVLVKMNLDDDADEPDDAWKPPKGFAVWADDDDPTAVEEEAADRRERGEMLGPPGGRRNAPTMQTLRVALEMPSGFCSGCGIRFQSQEDGKVGYVPASVLDARREKVERSDADAPVDEVVVARMPKADKELICQRCHALRYKNSLPADTLRVGGGGAIDVETGEVSPGSEELSPAHFRALLRSLKSKQCVVVCLVDLFDFHGSLVPELSAIVAEGNPLMLVANKVDLLPKQVTPAAIERWVRSECRRASLPPIDFLDLVSAKTGEGMPRFLERLEKLMSQRRMDAYVLGAANAGKSSLLNYVLSHSSAQRVVGGRAEPRGKQRGPAAEPARLTTSALPGTTLGFVKAALLGGKHAIYDTPGLILPNQLTTLLITEELAAVVPKKRSQHLSIRRGEGECFLLGGLAQVHVVEGRPFLFTLYLANEVTVHPTLSEKAEEVLAKHIGGMLNPPASAERLAALGEFGAQEVVVQGRGWNEVAVDLVLPGLGWVAVTGSGTCTLSVRLPHPVRVVTREPLLPDESWKKSAVKYNGATWIDKRGNAKRPIRSAKL